MRGVEHDHVHLGVDQRAGPLQTVLPRADGGGHAQTPERVLRCLRVAAGLLDVLDCNQAFEVTVLVDDEELLDPMVVQNLARLLEGRAHRHRDEVLLGHALGDGEVEARLEAKVAVGENAHQLPVRIRDRDPRDLVLLHDLQRLGDGLPRPHGHRVHDHPRLGTLDLVHFLGLAVDGHVLVNHAQAAMLSHGDGQARFGDRVHGRGDDGDVQVDVARQAGGDVDEVRVNVGAGGLEQDVVEGQSQGDFLGKPVGGRESLRLLGLVKLDPADHRNIAQYPFVAHRRLRI